MRRRSEQKQGTLMRNLAAACISRNPEQTEERRLFGKKLDPDNHLPIFHPNSEHDVMADALVITNAALEDPPLHHI